MTYIRARTPKDQVDTMSSLDMPLKMYLLVMSTEILLRIIDDFCLVHTTQDLGTTTYHPGAIAFTPHYTTTVSTPHLQIRVDNKLLCVLYPTQDLRRENLLVYIIARSVFFEGTVSREFEALAQSMPRPGVVDGTVHTHHVQGRVSRVAQVAHGHHHCD